MLTPHLEPLPEPQQRLWLELKHTPKTFVLYGDTALALYLNHRQSEDFDFFSSQSFHPTVLLRQVPYLRDAQILQQSPNTCGLNRRKKPYAIPYFFCAM